jgi:uncharacterized membrane protein YedE/YeeE
MALDIHTTILLGGFAVAAIAGATMAKTNFCTMGAVADWVNMGHLGRLRAWMLAVAVAIAGLLVLEWTGIVKLPDNTFPPYRTPQFAWARYLLGGALFGIGMALGGGCGTKTLIRVGGGSLRALFVAAVIAAVAYATFATDIFNVLVMSWLEPTVVNLSTHQIAGQSIDALLGLDPRSGRAIVGLLFVAGLLAFVFSSAPFRRNRNLMLGGVVVGAAVVLGWYLTGGPHSAGWIENAEMAEPQPSRVQVQTMTFIAPLGDTLRFLMQPGQTHLLSYGIMTVFGVVAGSFAYSLAQRRLRLEWFASWRDFASHLAGGVLMGFGGVTAMGCTIGQGIGGMSTLALGSLLALLAMIAGAAATIKLQYVLSD